MQADDDTNISVAKSFKIIVCRIKYNTQTNNCQLINDILIRQPDWLRTI